jgi:hypothetical protein
VKQRIAHSTWNGIRRSIKLVQSSNQRAASETGDPSIDEFQGIDFPGEGFGTKWLVDRGTIADDALVGETSGFGIVQAQCGAAWFKIGVEGREVYTPRYQPIGGNQHVA